MIKVGIVGGTGYTGVELLRLLAGHPDAELRVITSRGEAGRPVADLFPSLRHHVDVQFSDPETASLDQCDVVFFATPNGVAMQHAPRLIDAGVKVVDLSADFRLTDIDEWERWYGQQHACPELVTRAVYGLPELNRAEITGASLVANPGCYPTVIQLGLLPLLEHKLVDPTRLIADAKSGVSGAGRTLAMGTQFCEISDSFHAYGVAGHRHLPEIRSSLGRAFGQSIGLTFVPHLTPINRGLHATLYATLYDRSVDLQSIFESRYANEPFVDVMPEGSHPDTRTVRGSNFVRLACFKPQQGDTAVILGVEDNLVKGAAGQAIQNMNLIFGLEETTGLKTIALTP